MTIGTLGGEFALIERIAKAGMPAPPALRVGIGDDAAVLGQSSERELLVTTDLLIEDVHFRRSYGDPFSLGVKAAAVNLSDIASMAGTPTAAFLSVAFPRDTEVTYVDAFYRGLRETLGRHGAFVAGGDTNVSERGIVINVTQLGTAQAGQAVLRSEARPGDALLVTGSLGDAAGGFALLEALGRDEAERVSSEAVGAQLRPVPRLPEARAAIAAGGVSAMMDLSDGLAGDLEKLCRASGVGAIVQVQQVPVGTGAQAAAERLSKNPLALSLRGGEDYELLLTCAPESVDGVIAAIRACGTPATVVGAITSESGISFVDAQGTLLHAPPSWDHFAA